MKSRQHIINQLLITCAIGLLLVGTAKADLFTEVQTFYVPVKESDIQSVSHALHETAVPPVRTVISIAAAFDGTELVYDHWEDGYETDITNPAQTTTEIWGDGDALNGFPPGVPGDIINSGQVITLDNKVPLTPVVNPDGSAGWESATWDPTTEPLYDARDKFAVNESIAVTRAAWTVGPGAPGTKLAGAIEVYDTSQWSQTFQAPVGEEPVGDGTYPADHMFELVTGSFMAQQDGTELTFNIGGTEITETLNEGQSYLIGVEADVKVGSLVNATKPIQAHMITGDIGSDWESRWFTLFGRDQWSDSYYTPTSSRQGEVEEGELGGGDPTDVFFYNPSDASGSIEVFWEFAAGFAPHPHANWPTSDGFFTVEVGETIRAKAIPNGSGARFYTKDGSPFYAITTIDSNAQAAGDPQGSNINNRDYDWAFALIPDSYLSTQALVGWAPGVDPDQLPEVGGRGSPVWVISLSDTTVTVDYGSRKADIILKRLEQAKIFDTDDNDMTGALIYTTDGTKIAAAWGQDPDSSKPPSPYLDLGTAIPSLPLYTLTKNVTIGEDGDDLEANPGDTLTYEIVIANTSKSTVPDVRLTDEYPRASDPGAYITYEAGSCTLRGEPVGDDGGDCGGLFTPVGEDGLSGGLAVGDLEVGDEIVVTFRMQIDIRVPVNDDPTDDCQSPETSLINVATAFALGYEYSDDATTCVVFNPAIDIRKNAEGPDSQYALSGDPVTFDIVVTNTGDVDLSDVTVTDDIAPDCTRDNPNLGVLAVGASTSYQCTMKVTEDVTNVAYVIGTAPGGRTVDDSDPSSVVVEIVGGGDGCTPGYWKQKQHFDSWDDDYSPDQLFASVFENAFPGKTLLQVLKQGGGGLKALGRHTVAALLNGSNAGVSYDLSASNVISDFNAVYPGSKKQYTALKNVFVGFNEQGCPLN